MTEQDAKFIPLATKGRAIAIRVYAIRPEGKMASIGLRDGDAIYAVNGRTIREHSSGIIRELYLERRLILQVERGGEHRLIHWAAS